MICKLFFRFVVSVTLVRNLANVSHDSSPVAELRSLGDDCFSQCSRVKWRPIASLWMVGGLTGFLWLGLTYTFASAGYRASVASAAAFICCVPLAYVGHRIFTFRSQQNISNEAPKFLPESNGWSLSDHGNS